MFGPVDGVHGTVEGLLGIQDPAKLKETSALTDVELVDEAGNENIMTSEDSHGQCGFKLWKLHSVDDLLCLGPVPRILVLVSMYFTLEYKHSYCFLASLLSTRFPSAGFSAAHF